MHILGHNMAMARALEESEMDTSRERERQTETETEMETKTTAQWGSMWKVAEAGSTDSHAPETRTGVDNIDTDLA